MGVIRAFGEVFGLAGLLSAIYVWWMIGEALGF